MCCSTIIYKGCNADVTEHPGSGPRESGDLILVYTLFDTQNFASTTRRRTQQAIEIPALDGSFLCCEVGGPRLVD